MVTDHLRRNRKTLGARWIPTASPELNAMEECWRQGEKDLSALPIFPASVEQLKGFLARYYRMRRFNLDMRKFLLTDRCCS